MSKITRTQLLTQARSWLGVAEGSQEHHDIVDCYNTQSPLPRGYKVTYSDAWCATFVTACFIRADASDMITGECGCQEMINKNQSIWVEDDNYIPSPGDLIFYDWADSGSGDNTGWADHVGIVETVTGAAMTIIEGNSNDSVRRVSRTVGQQYIRGYITPEYAAEETTTTYYLAAEVFPENTIFTSLDQAIAAGHNVYTLDGQLVYQPQTKYYAATTAVYLRKGPSKAYVAVCVIPQKGQCEYLAEENGWFKLKYNGKEGWSKSSYFSEVV